MKKISYLYIRKFIEESIEIILFHFDKVKVSI